MDTEYTFCKTGEQNIELDYIDLNALDIEDSKYFSNTINDAHGYKRNNLSAGGLKSTLSHYSVCDENSSKRTKQPNLLKKSILAKARRKEVSNKNFEDDIVDVMHIYNTQRIQDEKSIVSINIEDAGDQSVNDSINRSPDMANLNMKSFYMKSPSPKPKQKEFLKSKTKSTENQIEIEKADAFSRVEEAYEAVHKSINRKREDKIAGIPTNAFQISDISSPQFKVLYEEKASKYNRRKRAERKGFTDLPPSSNATKSAQEKNTKENNTPAKSQQLRSSYSFPKENDFIGSSHKIESMGIGWRVQSSHHSKPSPDLKISCRSSSSSGQIKVKQKDTFNMKSPIYNCTIPGKLCKNSYPVTEAMHKEGTSITKRKGKTLDSGSINVSKVWFRKLDFNSAPVTPIQMAHEDGKFSKSAISKKYEVRPSSMV